MNRVPFRSLASGVAGASLARLAIRGNLRARTRARHAHSLSLDALEDRVALSSMAAGLGAAGQFAVLGLSNTRIASLISTVQGNVGVS